MEEALDAVDTLKKAKYELKIMIGNGCIDYRRLEAILDGKQ